MRDLPESRRKHRLRPGLLMVFCALSAWLVVPAIAPARPAPRDPEATAARHKPQTPAQRRRAKLQAEALKKPTLTLDSSFIRRAQAVGSVVPFTIRLKRAYEGGPGDDVLQLNFDTASTPWPMTTTAPPAAPPTTNLTGALTYVWDYSADTSGYTTQGTTETVIGGGIAMTGTGFPLASALDTVACPAPVLSVTGVTFSAAGARFGTINPFTGDVSGTINVRTAIRTKVTPCTGPAPVPDNALATTAAPDPPLPVAFTGKFTVSPTVSSDGRIRLGLLTIDDAKIPQRTTFGLIHACTDPTAADGCARKAFPVRTKLVTLTAEVLAGDQMPPAPAAP
jgi:hypothetical protein